MTKEGAFKRTYYTLPGFNRVAAQQLKFLDLASVAVIGWLFFEEVDLIPPGEHKKQGVRHVILLKGPREKGNNGRLESGLEAASKERDVTEKHP